MNQIQITIADTSDTKFISSAIKILQTLEGADTQGCAGSCHSSEVAVIPAATVAAVVANTQVTANVEAPAPVIGAVAQVPTAPAAPVAPAVPSAPADAVTNQPSMESAASASVDASGLPWDERIHSSTKVKNADGTWRVRRGVDKDLLTSVTAELRGQTESAVAAPLAQAPAVPPAPVPTAPSAPVIPTPPVPTAPAAAAPSVQVPSAPSIAAPSASSVPVPPAPAAQTVPAGSTDLKQHLSAFTRLVIAISKQQVAADAVVARAAEFGLTITAPVELREADVALVEGIAVSFGI